MSTNKFMSYDNLKLYDENIKSVIDIENSETLASAQEYTDSKIKEVAGIDVSDLYTKTEVDTALSNKSDINHDHDDKYDKLGSANESLEEANQYTDEQIASEVSARNAAIDSAKNSAIAIAAADTTEKAEQVLTESKSYTDTKTSDLASTTVVDNKISTHNASTSAHNDIRVLITDLKTKLDNFLDVDDTTTDQLSEVLTLIENNKDALESLVTNKVNVSDIIDNLTTASTNKVLSANQGVEIKKLIDALQTDLNNKSNSTHNHDTAYDAKGSANNALSSAKEYADTIKDELDVHTENSDVHVTTTNKSNWGSAYTHSTSAHAPINAEKNIIVGIQKNGTDLTVDSSTRKVNITVPTTAAEVGAATADHNHDSKYDSKGSANTALNSAKEYSDDLIADEVTARDSAIATAKSSAISTASSDAKTKADNALTSAKSYTDTKVSNLASTTVVDNKISSHNSSTSAHNDIRVLIDELTTRLNTLANSTDEDLDQMAEIVDYIKSNKSLIDSVTTSKINVSDIVDNLTTASTSKVLSANQGVAIKALIDALQTSVNGKAPSSHSHTITASASDDDVVVLTGTNGSNKVTYSASHATSGVTAGTYKSVTVNKYGHVTTGSNPTTLSGYGITDAAKQSDLDALSETVASKSDTDHTHDGRYYTETEIDTKLASKANTSHGNHVPATETANNAKFLRNDNTWATVTPANIGAATSSHTHKYAGSSSAGGAATSASTVYSTVTNPTSGTIYQIPFMAESSSSGNISLLNNDGIGYWSKEGTTSATGVGELKLGNNKTSGTAGNKVGMFYIYGTSSGYTEVKPSNNTTSNVVVNLPSSSGTLALTTSNVSSATSATKATQDASGNVITSTYATKTELDSAKSSLQTSINSKANSSHTHTIANITNLQTTLDGKAASSHTHSYLPLAGGTMTGSIITPKDDNMGIIPNTHNYGQIGSSDKWFYKMYATNHYGNTIRANERLEVLNRYDLGAYYNYSNGYLIEIGASKASTMVAIHITGNSYNTATAPINSIYQFYDYGDGTIMSQSARNFGLALGTMTVYRYNSKLYAHIKQTASYQTLSFELITNKSGLAPTVTNSAAHTSGYTDLITITPDNVALSGHTHSYASTTHTHTVSHTPAGTVSKPSFTGSSATTSAPSGTTTVYSITDVGTAPSLSTSVTNQCLTLTFSAGSVPTRSSVTLPNTSHTHTVTATGSVSQPTFTGTAATLTTSKPS